MSLPIQKIGKKIRDLRKNNYQTLEELSQNTGLSKGMLSQIERGITQPSLETLWKISKVFDISMSQFFNDTTFNIVRRENRRQIVFQETNRMCYLVGQGSNGRLKTFEIMLEPEEFIQLQLFNSDGDESLIILEGELTVEIDEENYLLKEGDSMFFESHLSPVLRNLGEQVTRCHFTSLGNL